MALYKLRYIICGVYLMFVNFTNGFNIATQSETIKYFERGIERNAFGEILDNNNGKTSFFGYTLLLQLINSGRQDNIVIAAGAPTELLSVYSDSDKEEGTSIIEPNPVLRRALYATPAMGATYLCETPENEFTNLSLPQGKNCTTRAGIQRDLSGFEISSRDALGLSLAHHPIPGSGTTMLQKNTLVVCAPLRIHDCGSAYKAEGACYVSSNEVGRGDGQIVTVWNKRVPCRDSCFERDIDLMFVVDGSYSVTNESFQKVLEWVKDVTDGFDITEQVQVGVVQYSYYYAPGTQNFATQPYLKTEISLGEFHDKKLFDQNVDSIKYQAYSTYTAHAINKTVKEDFNGPTSRYPDARRVMILLTDGYADDSKDLPSATKFATEEGVESFAVGVGKYKMSELVQIAGDKDRVITVNDFEDLSTIVAQLQRGIQIMEGSSQTGVNNELMQCEIGLSSEFAKSGLLVLGAVGAYDWSGSVAKYDSASDTTADIPDFSQVQLVLPNRTKESYLGYSVSTGNYNLNQEFVASGAPRYLLQGAVVVYRPVPGSTEFNDAQTIRAMPAYRQLGSYFGGSLLSTDINGDRRDDLLVGAPLYVSDNYDEGRVFVYLSQDSDSMGTWASESYEPQVLTGNNLPGGRFGSAIASAGDLNDDGYNDVIIGAPLVDGDRGAVFVYHGSADGIQPLFKQQISASELTGSNLQYFGQSLQGGVDLDGNSYPDVAVGAPKSDTVVIFRSRPVARFTSTLSFNQADVDIFECFNTANRQCLVLNACLTVDGVSVEDEVDIVFNVSLDNNLNRIEFRTIANSTLTGSFTRSGNRTLQRGVQSCWDYDIYVKQNILDYSTDITAVLNFDLSPAHKEVPLSSVRDPGQPSSATAVAEFAKNCGDDDFCSYDLGLMGDVTIPASSIDLIDPSLLELSNAGELIVISSETANRPIQVRLNLTNNGENAFGTRVVIKYSNLLSFTKLENVRSSNENHPACLTDIQNDVIDIPFRTKILSYQFDTRLGNIMPEDQWCYFELKFSTSNLRTNGATGEVLVRVSAETASGTLNDTNIDDNTWNTTNQVRYRADASANRITVEPTVPFNFTQSEFTNQTITSVQEIGINTSNIQVGFEIRGLGFSNIPRSTVSLTFPSNVTEDDHILYLYRVNCNTESETSSCSCQRNLINPYRLTEEAPNENNTDGNSITINPYTGSIGDRLIDCSNDVNGYCRTLTCTINNLGASQNIFLSAFFRLWTPTLRFANISEVTLRSVFEYDESSMLIINNLGQSSTQISLTTDIIARTYTAPQMIVNPNLLWVYIVAALGGLLLLVAIVLILYKTGFFKSKYADLKQEALDWNEVNPSSDDAKDQLTN